MRPTCATRGRINCGSTILITINKSRPTNTTNFKRPQWCCRFEMCSAKCFLELEVNNGITGNNRIRQVVPVAYDSIAELILCNVTLKLRGLTFKTVTSGGDSRGRGFHTY